MSSLVIAEHDNSSIPSGSSSRKASVDKCAIFFSVPTTIIISVTNAIRRSVI